MKNAVRNDTSVLLIMAAIFTGAAIPLMSGFLEPSQPPAVAAVEIGEPAANGAGARDVERKDRKRGRDRDGDRGRRARDRPQPAQSPPASAAHGAAGGGDDADDDAD